MIWKLVLIFATLLQFVRQGQVVANENYSRNATVDRNTIKSRDAGNMERYGIISETLVDGYPDSDGSDSRKKHAERRSKCTRLIIEVAQMKTTRTLTGNWISEFSTKNGDNAQQI